MSKIMYENFINSCIFANKNHRYQKKYSYVFRIHFLYVIAHVKNDYVNSSQRILHEGGFLSKWQPHCFIEYSYKAISTIFANINHQYINIDHTKKQTEDIPIACSYLLFKILFHFMLKCTSVPYLESDLCKLVKELDNSFRNFTFIKP